MGRGSDFPEHHALGEEPRHFSRLELGIIGGILARQITESTGEPKELEAQGIQERQEEIHRREQVTLGLLSGALFPQQKGP